MANTVTVVARVRAAKGKGDALAALLVEQAAVVRKVEPGCLAYRVHRSTQDPDLFVFYEMYVDDAAFALHRDSPHVVECRKRRQDGALADGAVQVEIFRALTE